MIVFLEKYSDISILYVSYAFLIRLRFRLILTPTIIKQKFTSEFATKLKFTTVLVNTTVVLIDTPCDKIKMCFTVSIFLEKSQDS